MLKGTGTLSQFISSNPSYVAFCNALPTAPLLPVLFNSRCPFLPASGHQAQYSLHWMAAAFKQGPLPASSENKGIEPWTKHVLFFHWIMTSPCLRNLLPKFVGRWKFPSFAIKGQQELSCMHDWATEFHFFSKSTGSPQIHCSTFVTLHIFSFLPPRNSSQGGTQRVSRHPQAMLLRVSAFLLASSWHPGVRLLQKANMGLHPNVKICGTIKLTPGLR